MSLAGHRWSAPLGGCDCYLLALDDYMRRAGQGGHVGVTFLELDSGFSMEKLRGAVEKFSAAQPILRGRLRRRWPGGVPRWGPGREGSVAVVAHDIGTDVMGLATKLLQGEWTGRLRFDVLPVEEGVIVLMSWNHLLFDARGVELALAEVARLAKHPSAAPERDSWVLPFGGVKKSFARWGQVRPFLDRYWALRESRVVSLGGLPARAGRVNFDLWHFDRDQTEAMRQRAAPFTAGIFALPYFLAVTMRAHAAVLRERGVAEGALECAIAVQGRKRGGRGPIFQNQVSQLFFSLSLAEVKLLDETVGALQRQFSSMTRAKCDAAFVLMIDWMRRLPAPLYRRFLRREASGQIASFYHAHTGNFLPDLEDFCGGRIRNGWHVPSVSQPPGTGLFFSEYNGMLTASLVWREGVLTAEERALMRVVVRNDLLGEM